MKSENQQLFLIVTRKKLKTQKTVIPINSTSTFFRVFFVLNEIMVMPIPKSAMVIYGV